MARITGRSHRIMRAEPEGPAGVGGGRGMTPTHFSLFSGIGGIDLAAEWAGFETIGQVEYAEYQNKVLKKHWPDIPRWKDVRDVTRESIIERCGRLPDLISGGFPCQPHSLAGKRKASADERDLWGEFARIICEVKPGWVLAENVAGLRSSEAGRFFGRVLRDMAEMGYHVGWGSWGASDIGAPHRRERIFIVANSMQQRGRGGDNGDPARCECALQAQGSGCYNVAHANDTGSRAPEDGVDNNRQEVDKGRQQFTQHRFSRQGIVADPDMQGCEGSELRGTPGEGAGTSRSVAKCACYIGAKRIAQPGLGGVPDGSSGGMDGCRWPAGWWPTPKTGSNRNSRNAIIGLKSGGSHKSDISLEQAIEVCGGVLPREVLSIDELPPQWRSRWPAGIGPQHEWEPPRVTSIKTNRAARLTALGNAVVPQQVYPLLVEIRRFMV